MSVSCMLHTFLKYRDHYTSNIIVAVPMQRCNYYSIYIHVYAHVYTCILYMCIYMYMYLKLFTVLESPALIEETPSDSRVLRRFVYAV